MKRSALNRRLALVTVIVFALQTVTFAGSSNQGEQDPRSEKVDKLFTQWDKPDSPGCELAVIKDGQIVYKRGYGMANLEHNIPMSPASIMDTGSVSKQFTAMAIALLAEQGKLSLDDDVRKYVSEIPKYETTITIRHLIHHTSGIRDYLTLMGIAGMRDDDHYVDGEVVSLLARQKELNFKPGSEFLYSNSGYFLLSQIVKRASGKTLREFADEHMFKPLGMTRTMFYDNHNEIVKNRAASYVPRRGGGFQIAATTLDMVGDGNVFTCVEDLFLWDQNFYKNKLGKGGQELINQVLTTGVLNSGEKIDYAFGLVIGEYRGLRIVEHGGAFVGYRAMTMRFPDQRFSVVLQCNLGTMNPSNLARRIADIYLADQFKAEAASIRAPEAKFIELSENELKEKAGAYRNTINGAIWKITVKDGKLVAEVPGSTIQFGAVSSAEFKSIGTPAEVTLRFEKQDRAQTLSVQRGKDKPMTFETIQLVTPTPAQLAEYPGEYRSDEVQATYRVVLEGGKLFIKHENEFKDLPKDPLAATTSDAFVVRGINIRFTRDANGRVSAFTLNAGRVKNIRFVKK
ncbi:MAG TPA: serine hydrolase domain-containing protein [Blastocatellia bacterium]|nr:serine hydrolase domain-containing protein [Blastocatellia bacterium]